jgi:hypothetical protein
MRNGSLTLENMSTYPTFRQTLQPSEFDTADILVLLAQALKIKTGLSAIRIKMLLSR